MDYKTPAELNIDPAEHDHLAAFVKAAEEAAALADSVEVELPATRRRLKLNGEYFYFAFEAWRVKPGETLSSVSVIGGIADHAQRAGCGTAGCVAGFVYERHLHLTGGKLLNFSEASEYGKLARGALGELYRGPGFISQDTAPTAEQAARAAKRFLVGHEVWPWDWRWREAA